MTKRKVTFKEEDQDAVYEDSSEPKARRFKENHSLDSDDEAEQKSNEAEDEDILDEDDIEGQEEETIRNDEGITVTPFNLRDELEEGHFDAQGNYIANKTDENVTDEWLDSVDWNKVKYVSRDQDKPMEEDEPALDVMNVKTQMVALMKPGENVLKALRRLGGNKKPISSADRWKKKKTANQAESEETKKSKVDLLKLTGLADDLLQNGDFQIYEKTFEKLNFEIKERAAQFEDAVEDEDDELEAAFKVAKKASEEEKNVEEPKKSIEKEEEEVRWFYKIEDTEQSKLLGPFPNSQMLTWSEEGRFKKGVYCRKEGSEGSFYNSRRIDFDLYS
ncbi:CD2 antigen cytoplasmic tail-binding protein 2-like [Hydractinia symbiolongicarpus]|uniref:CD2 antigen cytoplasmic tail-binding protein 2-like n=1 Tax=Hydractinia symbiolongicarpus TaxID=13093 RepID=UPI00254A4DC9|nr:CD2 antigen cytoplasmic tail-binding protein 2-like [Hydractinia symbiolongicarpus]